MKNLFYAFFMIIVSVSVISCGADKSTKTTESSASTQATKVETVETITGQAGNPFQSIPGDVMRNLWENCELIDYIFYELPFSMNQSEKSGIQSTIAQVSTTAQQSYPASCKPIARQMYQVGGEIVLEADVYFSQECQFFVFMENNKPKYANQMTKQGAEFFGNIINQAMKTRSNIGQQ